ncbi:MAG: Ni/Fe-hydrogenase cytochrome b subunit [Kiloniellales bacterium]|nr:Ni/Fe-hydrogenase cytochrome b subunit [Kiloniellales bacterium]
MSHAPLRRTLFTPVTLVLAVLVAIAAYYVAIRFIFGLGAVTNLNPGYPWGIWVVVDIVIGTALGCGGFAMALLVYIFNRGDYHPLVRPALLGGLFGYTLAGMAVIIDLGRYWQAYNLMLPWYAQPNSVMFEVALCVMAYVIVLWVEFSPAFFERFGLTGLRRLVQRYMFLFIALGVLLPSMHQSSLGTLLLVMESQLSPLWYSLWLPLLFVISALAMGYAIVAFEATVVSETFDTPSEHHLLSRLSIVVGCVLVAFMAIRWIDLLDRGVLALALAGDLDAWMFWIENGLFACAILAFLLPAGRASKRVTFLGAAALLLGGSLYRLNAYLIAYDPPGNWTYFPSVPELMVTIGVFALEVLLYLIFVKTLPVLAAHASAPAAKAQPAE